MLLQSCPRVSRKFFAYNSRYMGFVIGASARGAPQGRIAKGGKVRTCAIITILIESLESTFTLVAIHLRL